MMMALLERHPAANWIVGVASGAFTSWAAFSQLLISVSGVVSAVAGAALTIVSLAIALRNWRRGSSGNG